MPGHRLIHGDDDWSDHLMTPSAMPMRDCFFPLSFDYFSSFLSPSIMLCR